MIGIELVFWESDVQWGNGPEHAHPRESVGSGTSVTDSQRLKVNWPFFWKISLVGQNHRGKYWISFRKFGWPLGQRISTHVNWIFFSHPEPIVCPSWAEIPMTNGTPEQTACMLKDQNAWEPSYQAIRDWKYNDHFLENLHRWSKPLWWVLN